MSDLYNRIEALCNGNNVSITKMCRESGVSRASLSDLKMGRHCTLSADALSAISRYFGVAVDFLLGEEEKENPATVVGDGLSEKERELIERFRAAHPAVQNAVLRSLEEQ